MGAIAPSQGSFQALPNGNAFIGWGSRSQFTDFSRDGKVLLHASYTSKTTDKDELYTYSYRVLKSPWIGRPAWQPKLKTYTHTCSAPLMAWVSWNGATEVASWRFHISNKEIGPWFIAGIWPRNGYETEAKLSDDSLMGSALQSVAFPRYVSVQALDANSEVLDYGEQIVETFVPPKKMHKHCTAKGCFEDKGFDYDLRFGIARICTQSFVPQYLVLVFLVIVLEAMDHTYHRLSAN